MTSFDNNSRAAQDATMPPPAANHRVAVFAGGCFWCMQPPFDNTPGVIRSFVGYSGGTVVNPTYEQIGTGTTGHRECIAIEYDPAKVSYAQLLQVFFDNIDPFDTYGQYVDRGPQYTTAIYFHDEEEKQLAQQTIAAIEKQAGGKKVATALEPAGEFYIAEDYHQSYYKKNPTRYDIYKHGSGRK